MSPNDSVLQENTEKEHLELVEQRKMLTITKLILGVSKLLDSFEPPQYLRNISERFKQCFDEMYAAGWCPYGGFMQDIDFFVSFLDILDSTRNSKSRKRKIDQLIFSRSNKTYLKDMLRVWRGKLPKAIYDCARQCVMSYIAKNYFVTVTGLNTVWQNVLASKVGMRGRQDCALTQIFSELSQKTWYGDLYNEYFKTNIMYQCYTAEQVRPENIGRHAVAHGWISKSPSAKGALNMIFLTDFIIALQPIKEKHNG